MSTGRLPAIGDGAVVSMVNTVRFPKDLVVVVPIARNSQGMWLPRVGDHTIVMVQGELGGILCGTKPTWQGTWDPGQKGALWEP